jgi:hypothetical protein
MCPVVVLLITFLSSAVAQDIAPTHFEAGPLKVDVYISETAQLFHVVDQISKWSEFSHPQYLRYFGNLDGGLNKADTDLLLEHAAIRKRYGWGRGPEQVFYTMLPLDRALAMGVQRGLLTADEARVEERVFVHFRPRIWRLMAESLPVLEGFIRTLEAQRSSLTSLSSSFARFIGGAPGALPVYLIANPDETSIGGGYNGGFLTLEIPRNRDVYPTFLHEVFHAFIATKRAQIQEAIGSTEGLNFETFNEGLAYALSPGLYTTGDSDRLQVQVDGFTARGVSLNDSYARFNFYGLALRPLLKAALADGNETLPRFLPRAIEAWIALRDSHRTGKP